MAGRRLGRYVAARDELLARITDLLQRDDRVVAAWLSGSFGRGEGDAWADFDLQVVLEGEALASFLKDRRSLYASLGDVALVRDEIPGQPDSGVSFHLVNFSTPDGPVEVDWSIVSFTEAIKPVACRLLFEKRPIPTWTPASFSAADRRAEARRWSKFFWSMAPIAVRFCGRGETQRAASQTGLLSRGLICLWRLLDEEPSSPPWLPDSNRPVEHEYDARLPRLGRTISPRRALDVIEKLCHEAELLQERLAQLGAAVDPAIIEQTKAMSSTARTEISAGRYSRRKFR